MSTSTPAPIVNINDLIPTDEQMVPESAGRELSRWVISFLTIDVRGRELGRNVVKMGVPTLIRTRTYMQRNDNIDAPLEQVLPITIPARNAAGAAAEVLLNDYADRGLRIIDCLTNKDTKDDITQVAALLGSVMNDPFEFDGAEDKDWGLFDRRRDWLTAKHSGYKEDSWESKFIATLLDASEGTRTWIAEFFNVFFHDAEQKRTHGPDAGGRTQMTPDEFRMCKWIKRRPTKFIDGYEEPQDVKVVAGPTQVVLPPEILALLAESKQSKDERVAALELELEKMRQTVNSFTSPKKN